MANLWRATAVNTCIGVALEPSRRYDTIVVGGGIMGASAALRLSGAGQRVALLEAGPFSEGASSRAGGFVVPHFGIGTPDSVESELAQVGERLVLAVGNSAQRVFALIREHGIECDARQSGWYQPAWGARSARRIDSVAGQWQRRGFDVETLDPERTRTRTGMLRNSGSWYAPSGGTLHPLDYSLGLLRAAQRLGARLHEYHAVKSVEVLGAGRVRVRTEAGHVDADRVLICTNATGGLSPQLEAGTVQVEILQCASRPLPPAAREHLFRDGACLSDTRHNLFTYRFDREWRLVTGMIATVGIPPAKAATAMSKRLHRELGLSALPEIDYLWSGHAAVSLRRTPAAVVEQGPVLAATACNGRGIALSTIVGEALADYCLGTPRAQLPLPFNGASTRHRILDRMIQSACAPAYPYLGGVLDWFESRSVPRPPA